MYKTFTNRTKGRNRKKITVIVGDLNTPLTVLDNSSKKKINKEISALNETLNQMYIIGLYRALHPQTSDYAFFSSTNG